MKYHLKFSKILYVLYFILAFTSTSFEQDIGNIIKSKPFDYNGSLNLSLSYYNPQNNFYRSMPWQYALTANTTAVIYGVQLPFNVYINNYQSGLNHPFNFYGVSPSYKWAKLHLGHRSISFSPYSLSGLTFWGAAIELNPGIFRFSALYGTFKNYIFIPNNDIQKTNLLPSFKRRGYGFKIGIGKNETFLDFIYFKAKDDDEPESQFSDTISIYPKENLVIGLNGSLTIIKRIHLYFNSALSAFTPDNTGESILDDLGKYEFVGKVMDPKISTRLGFAGDAGLDFRFRKFLLGIKYQRIDPSYESLGTNYFMNDIESLSLINNFTAFKNKFNLSTRIGVAHNNLLNNKISTNIRYIGSVNGNIRFTKKYILQFTYSNFQQEHTLEILDINDTIQYAQTNQILRIAPMTNLGNKSFRHSIRPVFLRSGFTTINGRTNETKDVISTSASLNYNLSNTKSKISFNNTIYWRKYESDLGTNSNILGTTIGINKRFKNDKFSINASTGYNFTIGESLYNRNVLNINTRISYKILKKQNISISGYYINRNSENYNDINELRFYLQYSYTLK
ncbi:MAG TPA: hypothetical protein ENK91_11785 [Bacteroidetes bacterium]|nr:hypothetical protein [Bacteroidota bacterium]